MTPQESELVDELFNRLVQLETAQRDPEAERLIADGLRRAPACRLRAGADGAAARRGAQARQCTYRGIAGANKRRGGSGTAAASFLDSMREALGGRAPHGSVPSVLRTAGANQSQGQQPQPGYPRQMPLSGYPGAPGFGSGGSFLGTAASAAAGVIGGSLLLDGIRSMFGHHLGGASASAFARGDDKSATYADREQDRQQDLADEDAQQDAQQDLADEDAQQDAEQDLADEDAQQDSEQDLADDEDFAGDDGYDA